MYLLGQIALCLVLAALAGWFIGWSWRGFRDQDAVEDARRTLHATQEVKERELTETYRRAETLQSRADAAQRRVDELERKLRAAERGSPTPATGGKATVPNTDHEDLAGLREQGRRLAQEESRSRALQGQLRQHESALTTARAEVASLRAAIAAKAEAAAALEARVIELEPLQALHSTHKAELERLTTELEKLRAAQARVSDPRTEALEEELRDQLAERDRALNELRNRHNEAVADLRRTHTRALQEAGERIAQLEQAGEPEPAGDAETAAEAGDAGALRAEIDRLRGQVEALEERAEVDAEELATAAREQEHARAELGRCSAMLQGLEGKLEEAQRNLQRQIERNRRQEMAHRAALAEARSASAASSGPEKAARPSALAGEVADLRARIIDEQRRTESLRQRLRDTEKLVLAQSERPARKVRDVPAADDLKRIRGIGLRTEAKLRDNGVGTFREIAEWDEDDIDRIGKLIGVYPARIRREDWVGSARAEERRRRREGDG